MLFRNIHPTFSKFSSSSSSSTFPIAFQCLVFYPFFTFFSGHVARTKEGRSSFKMLTGKPTGKRPFGRLTCRWVDNIRIDLKAIGINGRNWLHWAQDRYYWSRLWMRHWTSGLHKSWSWLVWRWHQLLSGSTQGRLSRVSCRLGRELSPCPRMYDHASCVV